MHSGFAVTVLVFIVIAEFLDQVSEAPVYEIVRLRVDAEARERHRDHDAAGFRRHQIDNHKMDILAGVFMFLSWVDYCGIAVTSHFARVGVWLFEMSVEIQLADYLLGVYAQLFYGFLTDVRLEVFTLENRRARVVVDEIGQAY